MTQSTTPQPSLASKILSRIQFFEERDKLVHGVAEACGTTPPARLVLSGMDSLIARIKSLASDAQALEAEAAATLEGARNAAQADLAAKVLACKPFLPSFIDGGIVGATAPRTVRPLPLHSEHFVIKQPAAVPLADKSEADPQVFFVKSSEPVNAETMQAALGVLPASAHDARILQTKAALFDKVAESKGWLQRARLREYSNILEIGKPFKFDDIVDVLCDCTAFGIDRIALVDEETRAVFIFAYSDEEWGIGHVTPSRYASHETAALLKSACRDANQINYGRY